MHTCALSIVVVRGPLLLCAWKVHVVLLRFGIWSDIGMTNEDLVNNLGSIARGGTKQWSTCKCLFCVGIFGVRSHPRTAPTIMTKRAMIWRPTNGRRTK